MRISLACAKAEFAVDGQVRDAVALVSGTVGLGLRRLEARAVHSDQARGRPSVGVLRLRQHASSDILREMEVVQKEIIWLVGTLEELKSFPEEVQDDIGYALQIAQEGEKHSDAKPLKGFGGAGVLEVVDDFDGETYRAVYTVKFSDALYVLHVFQKKSRKGIKTNKHDVELVKQRLKRAAEIHAERISENEKRGETK